VIDYHGQRQPCVAVGKELLAGMAVHKWDYYKVTAQAYHGSGHPGPLER
jgi:hypothetical protein